MEEFITHIQINSDENSQTTAGDENRAPFSTPGISGNLFLRLAASYDDQPDASYLGNTCNNAFLYALTTKIPISNSDFPVIMIDTGAA